jgi:hypothetical protein
MLREIGVEVVVYKPTEFTLLLLSKIASLFRDLYPFTKCYSLILVVLVVALVVHKESIWL